MRHLPLICSISCLLAADLSAQSIRYEVPAKAWAADLGSHRAVVKVSEPHDAVRAELPWRRRDPSPEKKAVIVVEAATGKRVDDVLVSEVSPESGEVVFAAKTQGEYFLYFLPGNPGGGSFPVAKYVAPEEPKNTQWRATATAPNVPTAPVVRWEARTEHDRFNEMEIIATAAEREAWLKAHPGPFAVFPEVREHSVRMFNHVPEVWISRTQAPEFSVRPNEFYPFQLVVWAGRGELKNLRVNFTDLSGGGTTIPASSLRCLQAAGVNYDGQAITHTLNAAAGEVLPLWCALDLSRDVKAGKYTGTATIEAEGQPPVKVPLIFAVSGAILEDRGDSEPERFTKLRWLDSKIGLDDAPTRGFTEVTVEGHTLKFLGRSVELSESGLPEKITSFFHPGVTKITNHGTEILSAPMRFVVELEEGTTVPLTGSGLTITRSPHGGLANWTAKLTGKGVTFDVHGELSFDGNVALRCQLTSPGLNVRNVRLEIPRTSETTSLVTGLGNYGGNTPEKIDWKWDVAKRHQDAVWLGATNAGLRVQLRAENYFRPYVNIHYTRQPLNSPPSWDNGGRGGIQFTRGDKESLLTCYSGALSLGPEKPLHFDFDLSITPFRTLNPAVQWRERYYQTGSGTTPPDKVKEMGANVINIHQGNTLNPYINYPFLTSNKLADYASKVHADGMRVKYYYTVRELTNWTPELFAARAFGNELIAKGKGEGHAWCEEHLGGEYWQAWYEPGTNDASILTASLGRWNNLYLQGLDWMVKNAGCDGLYLDDISYDRTVMLRARRILDGDEALQKRGGGLIDLHSWNEIHHSRAGYASCVLAFMESFPFVDRVWFGEGHPYTGPANQTLVAISGIPFGNMGEMLEGGGNPWLGLTFGMTGRLGWGGEPRPVWKLWDDFGIDGTEFIGWWDTTSPVKPSTPEVKATLWKKNGRTLIALANFGDKPTTTTLEIDWKALGLDPQKANLYAPVVQNFQPEALYRPGDKIALAPKRGVALWVDETPRKAPAASAAPTVAQLRLLFEDHFKPKAAEGWKTTASTKAQPIKFDGEGQVFLAPCNTHLWTSRSVPADTRLVEAQIRQDVGDAAQQWGPGLALVWSEGQFVKVNCRADGSFAVSIDGNEKVLGQGDRELPVTLAISIDEKFIRLLASGEGAYSQEQELAKIPRDSLKGSPSELRIGKMPASLKPDDFGDPGAMGWSRCDWVKVHGEAAK